MADVSGYIFTGRLTKDAQIKNVNGKTLMELDVANNVGYGDYAKTNWLKVKMWGDRAINIAPIFTKGSLVGGMGELTTNEWTSNTTGEKHVDLIVTCQNVQLLVGKKNVDNPEQNEQPDYTIKDDDKKEEPVF